MEKLLISAWNKQGKNYLFIRTGNVWVMFSTPEESKKAFMALNDRFFRDRHIYLSYKTVKSYHVMFK